MTDNLINHLYISVAESASGNVFVYFSNSNVAGKLIVLSLLVFSLLAWTVMIGKYLDLRKTQLLNRHVEKRINEEGYLLGLTLRKDAGPYANLIIAAVDAHQKFEESGSNRAIHMGHIENALQRSVARQTIRYESKMILLGSIVTGAPFLGLLGTVWGVMDAFGGMGLQASATLQNLAPGVSGALLTTVAGLLVAIPSVFGYNFLLTHTKTMITELENYASTVADRVELELEYIEAE